jgi:hypothetical protein
MKSPQSAAVLIASIPAAAVIKLKKVKPQSYSTDANADWSFDVRF